jgi:ABC-type taurine transport system substrate-binding protein
MADIAKTNAVTNGNVAFAPVAIAASQTIPVTKDNMVVYIDNQQAGASTTITVKKGNGIAGVKDLEVVVPQASKMLIGPLESAAFAADGKITVEASVITTTFIGVIQL